jgi:cation transporter-like permease
MAQMVVEHSVVTTLIQHIPWFAWIALAAIASGTLSGIVKMIIVHRERIAMIRHGLNPDAPARKPVYEEFEA